MPRAMGMAALRVLQAVANGAKYGFDICTETGLASGTVYPALSRHEREGLLRSSWEDPAAAFRQRRPPRRYYRITPEGRRAIERALETLGAAPVGGSRPARASRTRG